MSQKQKMLGGVGILVIVVFGFAYSQFSKPKTAMEAPNFQVNKDMINKQIQSRTETQAPIAAATITPDTTVDEIIGDASLDDQALQDEVVSEQDAVTASGSEINNVSQTYDENQL